MSKRAHPHPRYPGELERLTTLIEFKAKELAEVLLWDIPDAELHAIDPRPVARGPSRPRGVRYTTVVPRRRRRREGLKASRNTS